MKDELTHVSRIHESIARIQSYTREGKAAFFREPLIQDAVIHNLEAMVRALSQLSGDFRKRHPGVPWQGVADTGDAFGDGVRDVNLDRVWSIVEVRMPDLRRDIEAFLAEHAPGVGERGEPEAETNGVPAALSREDRLYLLRIREAIEETESHTEGGSEEFFKKRMVQYPVLRNLQVIGQTATNLSPALRARGSRRLWDQVTELRDLLAHDFLGLDLQTVWNFVQDSLPELKKYIEDLLPEGEP
ncbi:MAG: DUF86 domain-containing protein [Syntrophobacteria bacterium]